MVITHITGLKFNIAITNIFILHLFNITQNANVINPWKTCLVAGPCSLKSHVIKTFMKLALETL